ncbi:MAG: tetratricopeptide repeat protein [Treponema sp.]|nr:tetratricopeptide repeat protein [Treponema sp.]
MKILLVLFAAAILVFSGCTSADVHIVPGEKAALDKSVTLEYFNIAESYKGLEKYDKAVEYYERAMVNRSLRDSCFYEIAICNVYLKNWNDAVISFRKLLKRDRDNSTLKLSLAYIEAVRGNLKKAEKMYEQIIEEFPDELDPKKNYINVLVADKKYDKAEEHLKALEEKYPDDESIEAFRQKIEDYKEDVKQKEKEELKNKNGTSSEDSEEDENSEDEDDLFGLESDDEEAEEDEDSTSDRDSIFEDLIKPIK